MQSDILQWANTEELGVIIRRTRIAQDLRQEDLAFASGVSRPVIIEIEAGKPTSRIDVVLRVVSALGLKLAFVTSGQQDATEPY